MNKEGFSEINIPAVTIKSCLGCKYYEHRLYKSGRHPEYHDTCKNPETELLIMGKRFINDYQEHGIVETPDWCPYLIKENN
jgi:hypothetical protein